MVVTHSCENKAISAPSWAWAWAELGNNGIAHKARRDCLGGTKVFMGF